MCTRAASVIMTPRYFQLFRLVKNYLKPANLSMLTYRSASLLASTCNRTFEERKQCLVHENLLIFPIQRRSSHKFPYTIKTVTDRIFLVLNLYDKIDNSKLNADSHFINDLGLDSLDHIEIITMVEEEFYNYQSDSGNASLLEMDKYMEKLKHCDQKFYEILVESVALVDNALKTYESGHWCIAFNGGKDCTALLHLLICRLFKYNIKITTLRGHVKEACFTLKQLHPEIEAVFMGTRKCDLIHLGKKNGVSLEKTDFQQVAKTDPDWPEFYRIYPLLKWDYEFVWNFLINLKVPYCKLYDQGYTSLGDYSDTVKNPALQYIDQSGQVCYKPAYELRDGTLERASRIHKIN